MLDESKIVLVDIDEVLWGLLDPWVDDLNKRYGLKAKVSDCLAWDLRLLFPSLTYEQILAPLKEPSFWDNPIPLPDSQKYIAKLQEDGYLVRVVSATSPETAAGKIPALRKHFPSIDKEDIILCERKELVRGDFLIDDNINNLLHRKYPILMAAPHNKCELVPSYIKRTKTWSEIYNYIRSKTELK